MISETAVLTLVGPVTQLQRALRLFGSRLKAIEIEAVWPSPPTTLTMLLGVRVKETIERSPEWADYLDY